MESPREMATVAPGTGYRENSSTTDPRIPWAWDKTVTRQIWVTVEIIRNKETRFAAGFPRIIICWFFDSDILIEKCYGSGRKIDYFIFLIRKLFFCKSIEQKAEGRGHGARSKGQEARSKGIAWVSKY
jgi:hypothetical protein